MRRVNLHVGIEKRHLLVILLLASIMALAFFLRVYWGIGPSIKYGFSVSGGSDSYYHERIITYILSSGHQLLNDPMLNYPIGMDNPRPPLFHWAIVLFSYIFYPFMNPTDAALLMLILFPAIWGTLTIIPVYLIGKEAFDRKTGLLAAFLLAIMPAHLMRSVVTQADWDAFDLFFIMMMFYFFLRALKTVKYKNWIKDWKKGNEIRQGMTELVSENKLSLIYASLAGVSLGALALAWKGFTYAEAILFIYLIFQIFLNRFLNKSNLHILAISTLYTVFGFGMALPWYALTGRIHQWFFEPFLLMLVVIILALYFEVSKKYPWPFVFLVAGVFLAVGGVFLSIFAPSIWATLVSGQGYFVKSKLYSTIAEAQPASLGIVAMSFGPGVFLLSILGITYVLYLIKKNLQEYYMFFVIYTVVAFYMAISAARFIFNAAPIIALTASVGTIWILKKVRIKESMEEMRKYRGQWRRGFRKAVKFSQIVAVLVIAFLVILPNVWSAVDAGIPYESKTKYDKQVYNSLPAFMKPNETTYNRTAPWYFGAFGYSIPKPEYPWQRAWHWLSEQDNSSPPEDRPAFVSWWDYGFEAIREGQHPAVADNFQNGYQVAAQIITAQNESEVISLFIARLLDGDFAKHDHHLSAPVMEQLAKYLGEENATKIEKVMENPGAYRNEVLSKPSYYGKYESDISDVNAKYAMIKGIIAHRGEDKIVALYDAIRNITGNDIRYFAVDYRLFPFSGRNTGIFYAPAKLGDRRVHQYGGTVVPYDFYELQAVDENGHVYDLDKVPMNARIVNYKITYKPMFYDSMLYRTFIGYSGSDIGRSPGIPGFTQNLSNYQPMQAWNMTHFKLVYRTAFWNPYKDYQNHTDAWKPIPISQALKYQKEGKGTVDLNPPAFRVLPNDVVMVKFYEGAIIEGRVTLPSGRPLAHIRVTLFDEYGIPHTTTFTDSRGYYKIDAVAGNLTLVFSTDGGYNKLRMVDKNILRYYHINVTEEQAERLKPNYVIEQNVVIKPATLNGVVYYDIDHNNKLTDKDIRISKGTLILWNDTYEINYTVPVVNGIYEINDIPPHTYNIGVIIDGKKFPKIETITLGAGKNVTKDVALEPAYVKGTVTFQSGVPVNNGIVELNGYYANYMVHTDENGNFSIMAVPDNYTLVVHYGNNYSSPTIVNIYQWNTTKTEDIKLKYAYTLNGVVYYHNKPVEGAIVKIKSELIPHTVYLMETSSKGTFMAHLSGGIYSIYVIYSTSTGKAVYFDDLNVNSSREMKINLQDAVILSGQIKDYKNMTDAEVSIFSGAKFLRIFANNTGYFETYLPAGQYNIGVVTFDDKSYKPYFARASVSLTQDMYITVNLHKASNITGIVYCDCNHNGLQKNETLKNGLVFLKDSHGYYEVRNIPPDGNFKLVSNINYEIEARIYGYSLYRVKIVNGIYNVQMLPNYVYVKGTVYVGGMKNNYPVTMVFRSKNYTTTITNVLDRYSLQLPPGDYTIQIKGENRTYEPGIFHLLLLPAEGEITKNITTTARAHIHVVSNARDVMWFHDGKQVAMGKDVVLDAGIYVVYASNGNSASVTSLEIVHNTTVEIPIYSGAWVRFHVENVTSMLPVQIYSANGSFEWKLPTIFLPCGTYSFAVDEKTLEEGIYWHYYAEVTQKITSTTDITLNVIKSKVLYKVYGHATVSGESVTNAILYFVALDKGKANVTTYTDADGNFVAYITPGNYLLYSWYILGNARYAYLGKVNVSTGEINLNLNYLHAYLVMGSVYLKGEKVTVNLHISTSYGDFEIRANKMYILILPPGNYSFSARKIVEEYGLKVSYTFSKEIDLKGNRYLDIKMNRNNVHHVSLKVIAADNTAVPGSKIHALVKLANTGNAKEEVTLESFSGWIVQGNNEYTLYPSQSTEVSVDISVPLNAKAGKYSVHLRAKYGDITDVYFTVNVTQRYNTTFNYTINSWNGNMLVYNLTINNGGNGEVTYNLTVLNNEELREKGWKAEIYVNEEMKNTVTIAAGNKKSVEIRLYALVKNPGTSTPLKLEVIGGSEVHVLSLPLSQSVVSVKAAYISAPDVSNYTQFTIPTDWYWLWGMIAVLFGAVFVIWRRRK